MEYCPHCMRPASGEICPSCGGQVHWVAPATQLPAGTLLRSASGRVYQIGAAKGQGGFGITYAALDLIGHQRVAVKEYYPTHSANRTGLSQVIPATGQQITFQDGMKGFLEEARMLSAVGALPSVVSVRDYFESNGTAYLVMEYVEGSSLYDVVRRKGPMPRQELFPLLAELLKDLSILHSAGVIHRDISPDNLILTTEGKLKLLDFGSARSLQAGKSLTVMLKAGFSPVEQYQSKGQGPYTDVYAMAGTIYYCLTGVVPPTAIDRISVDEIQRPNQFGASLTADQEDALLWGMTVQPTARPQNVDAFANALLGVQFSSQQPQYPQSQYPQPQGQNQGQQPQPQYPRSQGQQPQQPGSGSQNKTKKLIIGLSAGAAALVLLAVILIVVAVGGGSSKNHRRDDGDDERVSQETETTRATQAPTRAPDEYGTTDEGYTYEIYGGEATITGYVGSDDFLLFPDEIGEYIVTAVGDNCLSGNTVVETVYLPLECSRIGERAFYGCTNLRDIGTFYDSVAAPSAFEGCTRLRCVLTSTASIDRWTLPVGCRTFEFGMDTGSGTLDYVFVLDNGVTYGITNSKEAVIMDVPAGITQLDVPETVNGFPVTWMHSGSLDNASPNLTVNMCPDMAFDYSLTDRADWDSEWIDDFSYSWFLTCILCQDINAERSGVMIYPDRNVVRAAAVRAEEISSSYQYTRPDGSGWGSLVNETYGDAWDRGIAHNGKMSMANDATFDQDLEAMLLATEEEFIDPDEEGGWYELLGAAFYYVESTDTLYIHAIGLIK